MSRMFDHEHIVQKLVSVLYLSPSASGNNKKYIYREKDIAKKKLIPVTDRLPIATIFPYGNIARRI